MDEVIKALPLAPIWVLAIAAVAYVGRGWFDAALKSRFSTLESRLAGSLEIKRGLRTHEQDELVDFRVVVEKWEYFLQTGVADLMTKTESEAFDPNDFYERDKKLFGKVRLGAVKASIFLRNADLEVELLKTINAIRALYYPRVEATLRAVVDLQGQMQPYLNRIHLFEVSGQKDTAIMLNADEANVFIGLRHQMTGLLQAYAEGVAADIRPILEQLGELKSKINVYIYRPLTSAEIDRRDG
jgi:hypothetical protein